MRYNTFQRAYASLRPYMLTLLLCLTSCALSAANVLRVDSVSYPAGKTVTLPVILENGSDITAVQFDISLPFELGTNDDGQPTVTLSPTRAAAHQVATRKTGTSWSNASTHGGVSTYHNYRIMVFSDQNALILDREGTLLTLDIPLDGTLDNGAQLPVYLVENSVVLSNRAMENVVTDTRNGLITIEEIPRPDLAPAAITFEGSTANPGGKLNVSWKVQNVGQRPTEGGWSEQVSLVSVSGSLSKLLATTYYDETLAAGAEVSRQAELELPSLLGLDGLAKVQVQVVPGEKTGEHPSLLDNNTAQSANNLAVGKLLTLELSRERITEGYSQRIQAKLSRSGRWNNNRTFDIATNGDSRVELPSQVTIPAGQSGTVFYLTVNDNDVVDADSVVTLTATGDGYDAVTARLVIEDDEYPQLGVTASKSTLTEGDQLQLTITLPRVQAEPVTVSIASEDVKRFQFPSQVVIPAGETQATVTVTTVDDELPQLEQSNLFTVSAQRFTKNEVVVLLKDNDMPVLSLTLTPAQVGEAAGPTAVAAVLTRTGKTDNKITIKISDNANGGLYYSNKTLEMARGVETIYFNLGPVDNTIVDGDRTYTVTAGVWVSSCSCSASGEAAGSVSASLTVLDNDGAALGITSAASTVKEGGQTTLTVSRNTTDNASPLTVTLSSDYDEGLTYPHQVTIPAGAQSATVDIQSLANDVSGDSRTVVFTIQAEGYSSATCFLLITDQTLPDARITAITSSEPEGVVGSVVTLSITVSNDGAAPLPAGTKVALYRRGASQAIATLTTQTAVAVGESEVLQRRVTLPDEVGSHVYYAVVNEQQTVTELVYTNNTSAELTLQATSPFAATVTTDKQTYAQGEPVTITGQLTGEGSANTDAEVYFINDGIRQTEAVRTDGEGRFTLVWTPYALQSGHFAVGACYPGDPVSDAMAEFNVYGLKRATNGYITCDITIGTPLTGVIELQNPGTLALSGVKAEVVSAPEGFTANLTLPANISGGANATLAYTLNATTPTQGNSWEQMTVRVTSAEGASLDITLYCYARVAHGNLVVESQQLTTTMLKDKGRDYSFIVTNNGKGNTGNITLDLPAWMTALTGKTMTGLNQNDTATVVLRFTPTDDMQLNVPVTGRLAINCENGNGTYINFSVMPVSEATGTLVVDVTDEYTYYTAEAPHVEGAQVVLRNPVTGALVAQGVSDASGLCTFADLPEGYYRLNVTADKHDAYQNNILVDPGVTTTKVVTLSYQAVSVSWDVVETEVEDEYNIVTTVVYETNVPAPVIEIITPDRIAADQLGVGESLVYYAVLTNKGLITGQNTQFIVPETEGDFAFEPMVECAGMDIAPQQSIVIPVKVTRMAPSDSRRRRAAGSDGNCTVRNVTICDYECGADGAMHKTSERMVQIKECPSTYHGGSGGDGSGFGGLGGPNGDWYTVYGTEWQSSHVNSNSDCNDCDTKHLKWTADCAASFVPAGGGCAYGLTSGAVPFYEGKAGVMDYVTGGLTALGCGLEAAGVAIATTGVGAELGVFLGAAGMVINGVNCILTFNYGCYYDQILNVTGLGNLFKSRRAAFGSTIPAPRKDQAVVYTPDYIKRFAQASGIQLKSITGLYSYYAEVLGDTLWLYDTSVQEMHDVLKAVADQGGMCTVESLKDVQPLGITDAQMQRFVERLMNTADNRANGTEYENMIHNDLVLNYIELINEADSLSRAWGYVDTEDMWANEVATYQEALDKGSNSVCATISLQISQTMTMTRQAFRGTLSVYNGNQEGAMTNVRLKLNVTNTATGQVVTSREMEMHTESLNTFEGDLDMESGWTLAADKTGTATILFIPSKYAAPTEPVDYSFGGTLSYTDPYTGLDVTRELYPVTLTVKPSPELDLTYFMQRDIYGDDPLTEAVEPTVPAEFAVIVNNKGYGDATNVRMVTRQPEIVDNQKGLCVDFEFVSSQLNGQQKTLAMGETIPTEFGTIGAHSQAYAQWWLQSSLLGHFIDYDIEATHVSSYGNEDLSLLDQVTIHELIHGFTPAGNSQMVNGQIVKSRAFLVNDVVDADDLPDQMYFTDATQQDVYIASAAVATKQSDTEYTLTVTPSVAGWNYGSLLDPTVGRQKLISIVRQSDGTTLPVDNVWQTDRHLIDGKDWEYVARLHYVAQLGTAAETYLLTFEPKPEVELQVESIEGVPAEGTLQLTPLEQVTVSFNKPIQTETFTADDLSLACQGVQLDATQIGIERVTDQQFRLDLSLLTLQNGYYVLTVQTAGITDQEGFLGAVGQKASWVQFADGKVALTLKAQPEEGGTLSHTTGLFDYGEAVTLTATPATGYDFVQWTEGESTVLSTSPQLMYMPTDNAVLTAVFAPKYYDVTVSYNEQGGTVEGGGTGHYTYGTTLSLTAKANDGYEFKGWRVNTKDKGSDATLTVTVEAETTIEALFEELPTGTLTGRVTSATDDTPIAGATITLTHEQAVYTATTDAYGRYTLTVADKSLTYASRCEADGYMWSATSDIWFTTAGTQTHDFVLLRGATVIMPDDGLCTFSSTVALDFGTTAVEAYYVSRFDQQSFVAAKVDKAPAAEGLILKGAAGTRVDIPAAAAATPLDGNMLTGTAYAPFVVGDDDVYVMAEGAGENLIRADKGLTVPRYKAYCLYTIASQPVTVALVWDVTTLISQPFNSSMPQSFNSSTTPYSLGGRRVLATDKGLHVLKGKKVVVR